MVDTPLYVICDADVCARAGWRPVDFAAACFDGGARLLQIRAKRMAARDLLEITQQVVRRAEGARATVIVNDRADVARLAGAHGVHVGQADLTPAAARAVVGPAALVGVSTHTTEQIAGAVREPVSYIAIGPVFGTTTKDTGYRPVGVGMVKDASAAAAAAGLPVVAIGGITLDAAAEVLAAGAASVAVIGDLLTTGDPAGRVRQYLERLPPILKV
jgi:thiamine-phosphate pyrophosphorylase